MMDKSIWIASSETGTNNPDKNLIKSYTRVVANNMIGLALPGK